MELIGFAASIHPSDFSNADIRRRIREAAPEIFGRLPAPGTEEAVSLATAIGRSGSWYFRRKTRLFPPSPDFETLDDWLSFLKSPEGQQEAGGAISRYVSDEELADHDLADAVEELASVFAGAMQNVRYTEPVGPASDVRAALEGS